MFSLDKYAYASRLMKRNPHEKLLFSITTMLICLTMNNIAVSVMVLMVMTWSILVKGGTPTRFYLRLLLIPSTFLFMTVLAIAFNYSNSPQQFVFSVKFLNLYMGVTKGGIRISIGLFLKAIAAVSCLYYLSLTTPMIDVISSLKKLRVPSLFLELMSLIYRLIFVFIETSERIYIAQSSRLGYSNIKTGFRSFGVLASTLFIRAYRKSEELYTTLEARGYQGELTVLEEVYPHEWKGYLYIVAFNVFLIALSIFIRKF